jgi:hypothetical protein
MSFRSYSARHLNSTFYPESATFFCTLSQKEEEEEQEEEEEEQEEQEEEEEEGRE